MDFRYTSEAVYHWRGITRRACLGELVLACTTAGFEPIAEVGFIERFDEVGLPVMRVGDTVYYADVNSARPLAYTDPRIKRPDSITAMEYVLSVGQWTFLHPRSKSWRYAR